MPTLPKHLQAKPQSDTRKHPLPGMTYRVRDKDWGELWGIDLSYADAEKLVQSVVTTRTSKTARTEAEDIGVPERLWETARKAGDRAIAAGRVIPDPNHPTYQGMFNGFGELISGEAPIEPEHCVHCGSLYTPAPRVSLDERMADEIAAGGLSPADVAAANQLKGIHGTVLATAANGEAVAAQKRHEAKVAADKRKAEYVKQRQDAEKENKRLEAEALKLDAELDGANVPEGDIDDLIGGTGSMPTDDEIRKAKLKAAEEAARQKSLR